MFIFEIPYLPPSLVLHTLRMHVHTVEGEGCFSVPCMRFQISVCALYAGLYRVLHINFTTA